MGAAGAGSPCVGARMAPSELGGLRQLVTWCLAASVTGRSGFWDALGEGVSAAVLRKTSAGLLPVK